MDAYLGPQLPKERDAVGLFPRVSFRSCLQAKVKQEAVGEGDLTGLVGDFLKRIVNLLSD